MVRNNHGDGVRIFSGSSVDFRGAAPVASVTGNTGLGLGCFSSDSFYAGNVTGVVGNTGGGNDDGTNPGSIASGGNIPGCSRF